jgi:hypothetical protein
LRPVSTGSAHGVNPKLLQPTPEGPNPKEKTPFGLKSGASRAQRERRRGTYITESVQFAELRISSLRSWEEAMADVEAAEIVASEVVGDDVLEAGAGGVDVDTASAAGGTRVKETRSEMLCRHS